MDSLRERLKHCFALTFPDLAPNQYETATVQNTSGWDSMAQVTLLTVIGEEFGIDVDFEAFEGADSFDAFAQCVGELAPRG